MLDIIITIVTVIVLALVALIVFAATRPDTISVRRSLAIRARAEAIFPLIEDLRQFNTWNPYALRDPTASITYEGPDKGKGAIHRFAGPKSGDGHVEIVGTEPPHRVSMRLVMTKPFACDNAVALTLEPIGENTIVAWEMTGPATLMGKVMGLVFNMDKMVGKDFAEGLANLKAKVEAV